MRIWCLIQYRTVIGGSGSKRRLPHRESVPRNPKGNGVSPPVEIQNPTQKHFIHGNRSYNPLDSRWYLNLEFIIHFCWKNHTSYCIHTCNCHTGPISYVQAPQNTTEYGHLQVHCGSTSLGPFTGLASLVSSGLRIYRHIRLSSQYESIRSALAFGTCIKEMEATEYASRNNRYPCWSRGHSNQICRLTLALHLLLIRILRVKYVQSTETEYQQHAEQDVGAGRTNLLPMPRPL